MRAQVTVAGRAWPGTAGPRYGLLDEIAWYRGNSGEYLHEVGGKAPNPWGLYDMLGNVWDRCWDTHDATVYGDCKVLRGGGWFGEHGSCQASVRRVAIRISGSTM